MRDPSPVQIVLLVLFVATVLGGQYLVGRLGEKKDPRLPRWVRPTIVVVVALVVVLVLQTQKRT